MCEDYRAGALEVWRQFASDVTGSAIDSGHYIAEEAPEAALSAMLPFLYHAIQSS
jgi:haloacetate dehalogenase